MLTCLPSNEPANIVAASSVPFGCRPHRVLTWGRRVPEAADKIAVYRVKVFLFELF